MFLVRFIPRYFIIFDVFVTESFSRQIDKKFRVPKEEKVVWGSQSGYWGSEILKEEKRKEGEGTKKRGRERVH